MLVDPEVLLDELEDELLELELDVDDEVLELLELDDELLDDELLDEEDEELDVPPLHTTPFTVNDVGTAAGGEASVA